MSTGRRGFPEAVERLGEVLALPESDVTRDAASQRFETCYELAWKVIPEALRVQGLDCRSPRSCVRAAWSQGWIEAEAPWLAMLDDRNLTTHTYDESMARHVFGRLPGYLPALRALTRALDRAGGA